jgi:hypothetical protein
MVTNNRIVGVSLVCLVILATAGLCYAFFNSSLAGLTNPSAIARGQQHPTVRSLVGGLKIEQVTLFGPNGKGVRFVVRNECDKDVSAYLVTSDCPHPIKECARYRNDFITADSPEHQKFPVGGTDSANASFNGSPEKADIVIRAALFTDGSAEGEEWAINLMLYERAAMKKQLARILPHLSSLRSAAIANQAMTTQAKAEALRTEHDKLLNAHGKLPREAESGEPKEFTGGYVRANAMASSAVETLGRDLEKGDIESFKNRVQNEHDRLKALHKRLN